MKVSDLNAEALEICCEKTYQHEWPGSRWAAASDKEKATYRKEIAASIAVYLSSLPSDVVSSAEPR